MFDIGFLEIIVILIITLLVIGPERMPEVARKIGQFMGKMRRFISSVKEDGQMQETIKDFKDSMNLEEEKQQISQINNELQSGLNFDKEMKAEEFQRPSFGGSEQSVDSENAGSQFNKAPTQPATPKTDSNTVEPPTQDLAEEVKSDTSQEVKAEAVQTQEPISAAAPSDTTKS